MKTTNYSHSHPALQQLLKNTSSWIGHMNVGATDHAAGQTFECPDEGELENIQVYSTAVPHPGKVTLTLHSFNRESKKWGPVLSSTEITVDEDDAENWMKFSLPSIPLHKDNTYGFQLKSNDALVGIGEVAWPSASPFAYGEEWHDDNKHQHDQYYRYFSLAFKVGLRA
jgi:hypothetical protein